MRRKAVPGLLPALLLRLGDGVALQSLGAQHDRREAGEGLPSPGFPPTPPPPVEPTREMLANASIMDPPQDLSLFRLNIWAKLKAMPASVVRVYPKLPIKWSILLPSFPPTGVVMFVIDHPLSSTDNSVYPDDATLWDPRVKLVAAEDAFRPPHPKIMPMPIGIDSKLMTGMRGKEAYDKFLHLARNKKPPELRRHNLMSDAQTFIWPIQASMYRNDRMAMVEGVHRDAVDDWYRGKISFSEHLDHVADARLAICPEGQGMDTHRFYYFYALGTRCIVREGLLSPLHARFPGTIVVKSWSEVTPENVQAWIKETPPPYDPRLLDANFWIHQALRGAGIKNMSIPAAPKPAARPAAPAEAAVHAAPDAAGSGSADSPADLVPS